MKPEHLLDFLNFDSIIKNLDKGAEIRLPILKNQEDEKGLGEILIAILADSFNFKCEIYYEEYCGYWQIRRYMPPDPIVSSWLARAHNR